MIGNTAIKPAGQRASPITSCRNAVSSACLGGDFSSFLSGMLIITVGKKCGQVMREHTAAGT